MGVSGSGKSTIAEALAKRLDWRFADGDKFHPASNVAKMSAGQPLTDEDRWPWLQAIADEIDRLCGKGQPVVVACSALKRAYRNVLVHGRDDVRIVFLDGTEALIASRLAARRGHFMPAGTAGQPVQDAGAADSGRASRDRIDRRDGRGDRRRHHPPIEAGPRMTRIKLVVSDVDGTLVTKDKTLTDASQNAVRRLREAGIGFTIVSSRPTIGMGFLIAAAGDHAAGRRFQRQLDRRSTVEADRAASDPA